MIIIINEINFTFKKLFFGIYEHFILVGNVPISDSLLFKCILHKITADLHDFPRKINIRRTVMYLMKDLKYSRSTRFSVQSFI